VLEGLFDIKNDRRLSVYLYRVGFGLWLMYLVLGAPALHTYLHYRQNCGLLSFALMIFGFTASMVYDYVHHHDQYEMKKKWLFISYVVLAGIIYFLEFRGQEHFIDLHWFLSLI
jgi:4-hydroxybenzoate polyprenyltransferase